MQTINRAMNQALFREQNPQRGYQEYDAGNIGNSILSLLSSLYLPPHEALPINDLLTKATSPRPTNRTPH
jgi:hypothetical protein